MGAQMRFKITLSTVHGRNLSYVVCTPLDVWRAVSLTAEAHLQRVPGDPLHELLLLETLPGITAERGDIVDTSR